MIRYEDGQEAKIGDEVVLDHGEHTGTVSDVIDGDLQMQKWGVEEQGVMIACDFYGLLFMPVDTLGHDPVTLVSRLKESRSEG